MTAAVPAGSYVLARHVPRNRPFHAVFVLAFGVASLTAVVLLTSGDVLVGGVALSVAIVSSAVLFFRRALSRATLDVEPDALVIRGSGLTRRLRRTNVVAGYRIDETALVVHEANGRENHLRLDRLATDAPPETIDLLLAHLGVAVGQRAITISLRPFAFAFGYGLLAFFPLAIVAFIAMMMLKDASRTVDGGVLFEGLFGIALVAPFALAYLFGKRLGTRELVIGDDGLRIRSAFGTRVVRYDSLLRVDTFPEPPRRPRGVTLLGRKGSLRTVRFEGQSAPQIEGVVQRIREALARSERLQSRVSASLGRGSRTVAEWRGWLGRSVGAADGGFRDAALPLEALESLLLDPAADVEHRVGAALALREASSDISNVQRRVRIAAEASADPRVRIALEAAASDAIDEAALDKLLRPSHG